MVKKFRRRYLVFKLITKSPLSKYDILNILKKELVQIKGQYSPSLQYIRVISYNRNRGLGILRCDHMLVEDLRLAFKNIQRSRYVVQAEIVGVSGTLKALKRKFLKFEKIK
ncbi:MAG: hypothetical protein JSV20_07100 [Candidatus Bathyarchaeota archaeon]|nr:MAG: hypothetical protein JSV20_07100 [Candidatus Bathyarchaeota archaeon]